EALRGTGLDPDALKEGPVLWGKRDRTSFDDGRFPTPSGRLELFAPTYTPITDASHPYRLVTPKTHHLQASQCYNLPRKFAAVRTPWLYIHPIDAAREELRTGDQVRAWNARGAVDLIANVSTRTQPGVLVSHMVRWGENANATTTDEPADLGGNSTFHSTYVSISSEARNGRSD
ncbi:MAG: molybdopterin dinucleotide binding domain-containing protein, partial [Solirubrobacteraceae bacterium]